ncbi:MAG: xanthine dehydrogenase family protein molybdopterin-binding subunit, partial [Rhodospirillaceae bacterium]
RYLGLRVEIDANIGAYTSQFAAFVATGAGTGMLPGVYDFPCFAAKVRGFVTNTAPVDAYRGAGRPEAAYVIERLTDLAARELGMAPDALRALNMIPPDKMPYKTPGRKTYDSGDFVAVMDHAKDLADWDSYAERAAATAAKGLLRGRGLAYYIEACAGGSPETAEVILDGQGGAEILIGTQSSGQGHETAYAQITADALGLPVSAVRVVQGDTDRIATGGGTGGSRSLPVGGAALDLANDGLIAKASGLAAEMLETAAEDLTFEDGLFRMRSANRTVTLTEVAAEALKRDPTGGGLRASDSYAPPSGTYPNGCHICEVEVDPETGGVRFDRYVIVDDVGVTLNPLLLEGQVVGGAVQGWGQAMVESTVYDPQTGQLVTGSFMDYALPRADDLPAIVHATRNVPCLNNPLGIKGAGEAGTIGATPAAVNAVFDALWDKGVRQLDMPLSPARVYAA